MSAKPILRVDFVDFWHTFDKVDNYLMRALQTRFDVRLVDFPDLLIYSGMGYRHKLYTCRKLFYTGESIPGDFRDCDYAITTLHSDHPRSYRLPHYATLHDPAALVKAANETETVPPQKTDFCAFVVSQDHGKKTANRIDFFHRLSRYKKVSSGGRMLNNVGGPLGPRREDKLAFLRRHKFMIAFENGRHPGYITEKLYDAMEARCIPLYWGDPEVAREFNPKSFVNVADFPDTDAAIARVIEIDQNPALYQAMLAEPYFHDNRPNASFDTEKLCDFFETIRADRTIPRAGRGLRGLLGDRFRWMLAKRNETWRPPVA
jgi:hypothetical protein